MDRKPLNFNKIKGDFLNSPNSTKLKIISTLIPNGKNDGRDYVVRNPFREDNKAGSFRIDIYRGIYNDFSTGEGGNIISLICKLKQCDIYTAYDELSKLLSCISVPKDKESKFDAEGQLIKKHMKNVALIWNNSSPLLDHPYLTHKGIKLGNARINKYKDYNSIVVPLINSIPNAVYPENIRALQFIDIEGNKINQKLKGLWYVASSYRRKISKVIVLCEGFADGNSIADALPEICVLSFMSIHNLSHVVSRLLTLDDKYSFVICGDNDEAGREGINKVTASIPPSRRYEIIYPREQYKDFNEMYVKDNLREYLLKESEFIGEFLSFGG